MMSTMLKKDVLLGGAAVVAVLAIRSIIKLFSYPSLKTIHKNSEKALQLLGDREKLTIWGYEAEGEYVDYVSDASYYVSRVEAYCRAAKIPYTKMVSQGGSENPRGKVPFANVNGTMTDESGKIIELVKQHYKVDLDKDLSPEKLAMAHFIRETLHGSLYWVTVHFMFHTDQGRKVFRSELAHTLPPVILDLVNAMVHRNMHNNLHGHGMGRMPEKDIIAKAKEDMKALSVILAKNYYLLGTKEPTSYDCDLYAMLALLFAHPFYSSLPWVGQVRQEYSNLDSFFQRMKDVLYPEVKQKAS